MFSGVLILVIRGLMRVSLPFLLIMSLVSCTAPQNNFSNGMSKSDTQRLDIFVTGVVGRSMGSGHFSVQDIEELTQNAVRAFNENLKKL